MTTTAPETAMTDWRVLCVELVEQLERYQSDFPARTDKMAYRAMAADDVLARARAALDLEPVPPAEGEAISPSIEAVGPLIAWLTEQACQAADAGQPTDAGMLAWAAQVIGEQVDEDAPAPMAEGEAIGPEWQPCVKLPITVHVREQRSGETQVSTREGITPVRPDDLIMRGVQGEEYPIGRELFNKTYRLGTAGHQPAPSAEGEVAELALKELERTMVLLMPVTGHKKIKRFDTIRAALKRLQELENNADLSPAPAPAEGEVGDAKHVRRMCEIILGNTFGNEELDSLALLVGHHSDVLNASMVPVPVPVAAEGEVEP